MKIAHVVIGYHPSVGGTQLLFKGISEHCVGTYNDNVQVLTTNSYYGSHTNMYKPITPSTEVINGVMVRRFSFFRFHRPLCIFLQRVYSKITGKYITILSELITGPWSPSLKKTMDSLDVDIIVASPSDYSFTNYPLYRNKLKHPKPFVCQGALHFADKNATEAVSPQMLAVIKASDYYLANTQFEKDKLIELGVDKDSIVVTGVATDVSKFENGNRAYYRDKLSLKEDAVLIGYIGRIEKTKSIDVLVNAFVAAFEENSSLRLVIAGYQSDYSKELSAYVKTLDTKIQQHIFFEYNLDITAKVNLFWALDIFVLPSVNESFGIVFLEAWSCKKPVIGTNIGAIRSVINENVDGLLMNPQDKDALKQCILKLANNPNLRETLGNNGYKKTAEQYSWEVVTQKFRDTYALAIKKFNHV